MTRAAAALALLLLAAPAAVSQPCAPPGFGKPIPLDGATASLLVTGDFDGDGVPDVAFSGRDGARVVVLLLSRSGAVLSRREVPVPAPPVAIAAADLTKDGRDDLVVLHGAISIRIATASGDFLDGGTSARFALAATSIAVGDADGDGWPDVLTIGVSPANDLARDLLVFRNDGTGHLLPPSHTPLEHDPDNLAVGDFDHDGRLDLALASLGSLDLLLQDGSGAFSRGSHRGLGGTAELTVADLDGDGNLDVVAVGCAGYHCMGPLLDVLCGDGRGGFIPASTDTSGWYGYLAAVAVADFDGDGLPDLAVSGVPGVGIFSGSGPGRSFAAHDPFLRTSGPIVALDVFGDGRPALVANTASGLALFRNACGTGGAEATLLVPFVLDTVGADATRYASRLTVANRGASPSVDVEIRWVSALGGGRATGHLHLSALQAVDLLAFELLARSGIPLPAHGDGGTLRLRFAGLADPSDAGADVVVTAQRPGEPPTRVVFPAVPIARAFDASARLGWLRETAAERTNLAVANAGLAAEGPVTLRIRLAPDASSAGPEQETTVALAPGGFAQLSSVLAPLGWSGGFARIERVAGNAPWLAWAVVHDRPTGDASFLLAETEARLAGVTSLLVPALVDNDRFTSDLLLSNAAASERNFNLALGNLRIPLSLAPGEQRRFSDVASSLRSVGVPVPTPLVDSVSILGPDLTGLFAAVLVRSRRSGAGALAPSSTPEEEAETAATVPLPSCCPAYANLAILNAGTEPASFLVELFDGAAGRSAGSVATGLLGPGERVQLSNVTRNPTPLAAGWARVTRQGAAGPFVAYAVTMEGEGPAAGTGDGAWVPAESKK